MVQYREIDRFGSASQFLRGQAIGLAGPGITTRVVVRKDQARTSIAGCVDDDFTHRDRNRVRLALIAFEVDAAGAIVDMGDDQSLSKASAGKETGRKETAGGFMAVQYRRGFGTLEPHGENLRSTWQFA